MDLGLKGKRVLVFGASQGLGYAIAESFVQEGALVAISSRNSENLNSAKKKMGAELAVTSDTGVEGSSKKCVDEVIKVFGGVDILVTNTGGPAKGTIEDVSTSQWQDGFKSLWLAPVEAIKACLPGMKERRFGRIILVTSLSAKEPLNHMIVSNGIRAGLSGLIKSMSTDLGPFGITVNGLLPGYTRTERLKELKINEEALTSQIPMRRLCEPSELGAMAAFVASKQAAYFTGQSVLLDGGFTRGI